MCMFLKYLYHDDLTLPKVLRASEVLKILLLLVHSFCLLIYSFDFWSCFGHGNRQVNALSSNDTIFF